MQVVQTRAASAGGSWLGAMPTVAVAASAVSSASTVSIGLMRVVGFSSAARASALEPGHPILRLAASSRLPCCAQLDAVLVRLELLGVRLALVAAPVLDVAHALFGDGRARASPAPPPCFVRRWKMSARIPSASEKAPMMIATKPGAPSLRGVA